MGTLCPDGGNSILTDRVRFLIYPFTFRVHVHARVGEEFLYFRLLPHLSRVVSVEITRSSHFADRYREQFERAVNMRINRRGLP